MLGRCAISFDHRASRALIALLFGLTALTTHAADDAQAWLERMSHALATRSYDGQFVHVLNGRAENMRIVHRFENGVVTERLASLDGSGRELVRTDSQVTYYLPDKRKVIVERRTDPNSLVANIPIYSPQLVAYYELSAPRSGRMLDRPAQLIAIMPRDRFRYGYRVWVDKATAMPLRSELRDADDRVIEQMVFSELRLLSMVKPELLQPAVSADGFQWIRQDVHARRLVVDARGRIAGWTVVNPPDGFRLTASQEQNMGGSNARVRHIVFSDGLASVSIFIEPKVQPRPDRLGLSRVGASFAFVADRQDYWVTAVGEVPATTVEALARGMKLEVDSAAAAR